MPGGKSGWFPGIEKIRQTDEFKRWRDEEDLLREVGRGRLVELAQAEKDGRLVVLPCKVGDTVYFPVKSRWYSATIEHIEIRQSGVQFFWEQYDVGPETHELWDEGVFTLDDFDETVFLTIEEAEAALEEMESETP